MKLLLDANLSWRMISVLQQHFTACYHVDHLDELDIPAKDTYIWNYARKYDLIIVTNDEDFVDFINVKGFPPKVNLLIQRKVDIEILQASLESGLLEIISKSPKR